MKPRQSVFNSASEAELFQAIHGTWEPEYRLFPELPFANLVDLNERYLDAAELSFLYKTSVDFVLTTASWRPLFALEFDGLGHGYSRDGAYIQRVPSSKDKNREWKLGLKARVAAEAGLPFLVVSYDEKAVVDPDTGLIIAHGIIGQFLAKMHGSLRMQELYEDEKGFIEELPAAEREDYVQDNIIIPAEVEAALKWNPIVARQARLQQQVLHIMPLCRWGQRPLEDSPRSTNALPFRAELDTPNFHQSESPVRRWGSECWVETPFGLARSGPIWVRNFAAPGVHAMSLGWEIAELIAWRSALALVTAAPKGTSGAA